jgi:RNA polymerase sigma-70 factor (ECF subfamily)
LTSARALTIEAMLPGVAAMAMAFERSLEEGRALELRVVDSDQADIRASLSGDGAAYAHLVKRYESDIARQMWRFTRNEEELERLVQDVFVEAYLSLRSFKGHSPFVHWLRRIATRVGYRHWKQRDKERTALEQQMDIDVDLLASPEEQSPSEAAEYLFRLLERLPTEDRLVLTLMYFDDCDTREIAERTGWSRSLVKVRAHRARKKLKVQLEKAGYGRGDHE